MALDGNYEIKKGDTLWGVAKKQLQASGSKKPTNAQITAAMKQIAQANGCKDAEECKNKFFNKVGNKLDVTGFSNRAADETFVDFQDGAVQGGKPKTDKPQKPAQADGDKKPAETEFPMLTDEQVKELKEKLAKQLPKIAEIDEEKLKKIFEELKKKHPELFKPENPQPTPIGTGVLTHVKGESGDGSTTKAIGEEGGGMTTLATNEEGGAHITTMATNEEGGSGVTTKGLNEEGGTTGTTLAVGEEGGDAHITTMATNEEGGGGSAIDISWVNKEQGTASVTERTNEDGGLGSIGGGATTKAIGEEGGSTMTTLAIGEEGGSAIVPNPIKLPDNIKELLEQYLKEHPDVFKKS